MPPIMVGMMRQAMGGISEDELRNICARVGFGFLAIYAGASAEDALNTETLTDEDIDNLINVLQKERTEQNVLQKERTEQENEILYSEPEFLPEGLEEDQIRDSFAEPEGD
jgi:hypothetical protein